MTTRKELIINKYLNLQKKLSNYSEILPSLNDIDIADFVYFVTIIFLGIETELQYKIKIDELIETNQINIDDVERERISPLIIDFIRWIKLL